MGEMFGGLTHTHRTRVMDEGIPLYLRGFCKQESSFSHSAILAVVFVAACLISHARASAA